MFFENSNTADKVMTPTGNDTYAGATSVNCGLIGSLETSEWR